MVRNERERILFWMYVPRSFSRSVFAGMVLLPRDGGTGCGSYEELLAGKGACGIGPEYQ